MTDQDALDALKRGDTTGRWPNGRFAGTPAALEPDRWPAAVRCGRGRDRRSERSALWRIYRSSRDDPCWQRPRSCRQWGGGRGCGVRVVGLGHLAIPTYVGLPSSHLLAPDVSWERCASLEDRCPGDSPHHCAAFYS